MHELVFSTFVSFLMLNWDGPESQHQETFIQKLLDSIIIPGKILYNGKKYTVSNITAERLMNRTVNLLPPIVIAAKKPRIILDVTAYFKENIITKISAFFREIYFDSVKECLMNDTILPLEEKQRIATWLEINDNARFLSEVFLVAISRKNICSYEKYQEENLFTHRKKQLPEISRTSEPDMDIEKPYVSALLEAYGEKTSCEAFSLDALAANQKLKEHFDENRNYFYVAEAVKRGTRDSFSPEDGHPFEDLKNEIWEGVKYTYRKTDYQNGLSRLDAVLDKATCVDASSTLIVKKTVWAGGAQKKGLCHFLVNDGNIKSWSRK